MATFHLIRHAAHDDLGKRLIGRRPKLNLSDLGRAQAERLAQEVGRHPIALVLSSPMERALQTAEPLAKKLGLEITVADELNELDMGEWTDKSLTELSTDQRWHIFNTFRSGTSIPHGEHMLAVQSRIVQKMCELRDSYPSDHLAMISHGDVIKAALLFFLGMPMDFFLRLEIEPASVSTIVLSSTGPRLLCLNRTYL